MKVAAWNNGRHHGSGAGYGVKLKAEDRDRYFQRTWTTVSIELEGEVVPISVNVGKASFWSPVCRELINQAIGAWLIKHRRAPWPTGEPPSLDLIPSGGDHFHLRL